MLEVMLCGAADTGEVRPDFVKVVTDFGGAPLHYLSGDVLYANAATGSWIKNSMATVRSADLCIFAIVRSLGSITWQTEFREVLTSGKPFLVLALDETYNRYVALARAATEAPDTRWTDADRSLVTTLTELERDFQVTIVTYPADGFRETLRRHLSTLFSLAMTQLELHNRRQFIRQLFTSPQTLSTQHLEWATELALDEAEDKTARKEAVLAIALHQDASEDTVLALLASPEQGVQRLAFQLLGKLYRRRPPDPAFVAEVVEIANQADDVGLGRRLVPTLIDLDLAEGLRGLEALDMTDIGLRRRTADVLEANEAQIIARGLLGAALRVAQRCVVGNDVRDWKARLRALIERLEA